MKLFLVLLLSLTSFTVFAQNSWKVCLDKKTLLSTSEESEQKNIIKISAAGLKKYKNFTVSYRQEDPQKGWRRTISFYDDTNNELLKQTGNKFTIKSKSLQNLLQTSKTIKVYTIALPTDPNLAAQVRVRRVHLCTLVLE